MLIDGRLPPTLCELHVRVAVEGLTDAMLDWQTKEFLARETHRDQWTVYIRPELVVEIAFSDLQAPPSDTTICTVGCVGINRSPTPR